MDQSRESTAASQRLDPWDGYDCPITVRGPIDHTAALEASLSLCRSFTKMHPQAGRMIDPSLVLQTLRQAGVRFVLMGAHGIGGWLQQARATRDVGVVVRKSDHKKAVRAIRQRFPDLVLDEHTLVTRFLDAANAEPLIDLMRPVDLYRHAFDNAVRLESGHHVPNLELAIASKFRALTSRNRPQEKLHLDASDFIQMVKRHHEQLDRDRLKRLAESIFAEGGEQVLNMVDDVLAGRRLKI